MHTCTVDQLPAFLHAQTHTKVQTRFTDHWRRRRWAGSAVYWLTQSQPNVWFYYWSYLPPSCLSSVCFPHCFPAASWARLHRTGWTGSWRTHSDSSLGRKTEELWWATGIEIAFALNALRISNWLHFCGNCNTWVIVDLWSHLQRAGQFLSQLLQLEVNTVEVMRHTDSSLNGFLSVPSCTWK